MAVEFAVEPADLYFPPPLTRFIENTTTLRSTTTKTLIYKFKTTTPERYGVRPAMGVLPPNGKVQVRVIYKPQQKEEVATSISDRFQLQVRPVDDTEAKAMEKLSAGDADGAWELLQSEKPKGAAGEAEIAVTMWKRKVEVQGSRRYLACHFSPDKMPKGMATTVERRGQRPLDALVSLVTPVVKKLVAYDKRGYYGRRGPGPSGPSSLRSGGVNLEGAPEELKQSAEIRRDFYVKVQQQLSLRQELRGKTKKPQALSGTVFCILWVFCFYLGVVLAA
eukprot:Hpha_TRINITY_DN15534_c0_g8::TRINITY_DN15534_c0_g8_i2::g.106556::m.106556